MREIDVKEIENVIRDLNCIASLHRLPAGLRGSPVGFLIVTFWLTMYHNLHYTFRHYP